MNKVVSILGPTATGKTDLAISLCKKFNGEIISVDSRQAYKEMNIGTGKSFSDGSVPIHLYDVVHPGEQLNAQTFAEGAWKKIEEIISKNKVPFLVGGSAFYFDVILGRRILSGVGADTKLREELENLSTEELIKRLGTLSPQKLETIDIHNRYRLVRAIEVSTGEKDPSGPYVPPPAAPDAQHLRAGQDDGKGEERRVLRNTLILGLTAENLYLYKRADERVDDMVKRGLIEEVISLYKRYSWDAPGLKTLGYREFKPYFEGIASLEDAVQKLKFGTHAYIRRQKTYFKKYFSDALWLDVSKPGFDEVIASRVESLLK